ncbi:MAG: ABC transporter ATP-binding protein [Syntrophobacteraceae bacterium]
MLLEARSLVKHFGAMTVTSAVSLTVKPGEVHALIGPNGAGKTTLLAQLSGELTPDEGAVLFEGRDITSLSVPRRASLGIGRVYQLTSIFPDYTVLENMLLAQYSGTGHCFHFIRGFGGDAEARTRCEDVLEQVGLADRARISARALSHGEQRQLELAMMLALRPRLLLLDEPTAGMGVEETDRVVGLLSRLKGELAMLLVEHDMDAVFELADRVTVLVYGRIIAEGGVDAIRRDPEVRRAYLGDEESGELHA